MASEKAWKLRKRKVTAVHGTQEYGKPRQPRQPQISFWLSVSASSPAQLTRNRLQQNEQGVFSLFSLSDFHKLLQGQNQRLLTKQHKKTASGQAVSAVCRVGHLTDGCRVTLYRHTLNGTLLANTLPSTFHQHCHIPCGFTCVPSLYSTLEGKSFMPVIIPFLLSFPLF